MAPYKATDQASASNQDTKRSEKTVVSKPADMTGTQSPVLPPDIPYYFLPLRGTPSPNTTSIYRPMLLGVAQVGFVDKNTVSTRRNHAPG